jgi:putative ATP-dependent endonuclease of OLD family
MRIVRLRLQRFRGFEALTLTPTDHVLVVGEPRAGRSDLIAALCRVLDHRSTRRQADPLDVHRPTGAAAVLPAAMRDEAEVGSGTDLADIEMADNADATDHLTDQASLTPDVQTDAPLLTEVEVTLTDLDPPLAQALGPYLEAIDLATGDVVEAGDDGLPARAERGLRLCYRLQYDESTGDADHWVDFPLASNPVTHEFTKARASDRQKLPFVHLQNGRPLQLRSESLFRNILNEIDPPGTAEALAALGTDVENTTTTLARSPAVSDGLEHLLSTGAGDLLGLTTRPLADNVGFFAEDGTLSALLRGLQPAIQLDSAGLLPLSSHGSTASAVLASSEALVAAGVPGAVVVADDFGDSLDTGAAEFLAGLLRHRAGQLWLTTRRPEVARAFPPEQMMRLTRHTGVRRAHVLPEVTDRGELAARRHLHPQIFAALSATSIILVEGPHDLAGYGAIEQRRLMYEGARPTAAAGARRVAAGLGEDGGKHTIVRLARLARSLGFRVVALIDHDKPGPESDYERDALLCDCDVVVRLPPRSAVERSLVHGLPTADLRIAAQSVFDAFDVSVDLSSVEDPQLEQAVIKRLKNKAGLHAPFIAALGDDTPTPALAGAVLDAVAAAADPRHTAAVIEISLPAVKP